MIDYNTKYHFDFFENGGNMTVAEIEVEAQKIVDKLSVEVEKQISEINDISSYDEAQQGTCEKR